MSHSSVSVPAVGIGRNIGQPLMLVKSLQGIDKSYGEAKNLLLKAFSSPTLRKYEILDRLVALNLETPSDIYSYIGEMRSVIASVKGTDIDVDFVLQFFILALYA